METDTVSIKGVHDGIRVVLGEGKWDNLLQTLDDLLAEKQIFFSGGRVTLDVGTRELEHFHLEAIGELFTDHEMTLQTVLGERPETLDLARNLNFGTRLPGSGAELVGAEPKPPSETAISTSISGAHFQPDAVLVRGALRSGRLVSNEGHVTVIGDVNPGAEIVAGGDIVVWGRLRGLVHAGAFGDRNAVVCALELAPTQLRIADIITVSPSGPRDKSYFPEIASIKDDQIVAEGWDAGYRGRR